uniref:uncharacterized protein LOC120340402 n=1 Tax=Styela clava TaxID=7725 RepID=UPI0019396AD0|nr:uncharacterized protein LOC120340402 [Styela clava]
MHSTSDATTINIYSGVQIARLIEKGLDEKKKFERDAKDKCDVKYDSKCFRTVVYDSKNVTFYDAAPTCKSMNIGKPANIYDLTHFQLLRAHLRSVIPARRPHILIWTGMEYKSNQLLLSNGRAITIATEVWHANNYPNSLARYSNVCVAVRKDPENKYQGTMNRQPSDPYSGVICEV